MKRPKPSVMHPEMEVRPADELAAAGAAAAEDCDADCAEAALFGAADAPGVAGACDGAADVAGCCEAGACDVAGACAHAIESARGTTKSIPVKRFIGTLVKIVCFRAEGIRLPSAVCLNPVMRRRDGEWHRM